MYSWTVYPIRVDRVEQSGESQLNGGRWRGRKDAGSGEGGDKTVDNGGTRTRLGRNNIKRA